jgi:hypothetical protein
LPLRSLEENSMSPAYKENGINNNKMRNNPGFMNIESYPHLKCTKYKTILNDRNSIKKGPEGPFLTIPDGK